MATPTESKSTKIDITVEFTGGLELLFSNKKKYQVSIPSTYVPIAAPSSTTSMTTTTSKTIDDTASHVQNDEETTTHQRSNMKYLVSWLVDNLMRDRRKELFVLEDGSIRPGILVLINDADWELEGEEEYVLCPGDNVLFVSTLHGG